MSVSRSQSAAVECAIAFSLNPGPRIPFERSCESAISKAKTISHRLKSHAASREWSAVLEVWQKGGSERRSRRPENEHRQLQRQIFPLCRRDDISWSAYG